MNSVFLSAISVKMHCYVSELYGPLKAPSEYLAVNNCCQAQLFVRYFLQAVNDNVK